MGKTKKYVIKEENVETLIKQALLRQLPNIKIISLEQNWIGKYDKPIPSGYIVTIEEESEDILKLHEIKD